MEVAALVTKPSFPCAEFAEVAGGPWTGIIVELEDDSSCGSGVDGDFKLHAKGCELKKANGCGVKTYEDVTGGGRKEVVSGRKATGEGDLPLGHCGERRRDGESKKA